MKQDEAILICQLLLDQSFYHELTIDSEYFLRPDTRRLYNAISQAIAKGLKPDLISVRDIDPSIDVQSLVKISEMTHSSANWKYHEGKVIDAYKRKRLYDLGGRLREESVQADVDQMVHLLETTLMSLQIDGSKDRVQRLDEYGPAYAMELERRFKHKGELRGIGSGFDQLDAMTHGFQPRRLYYLGARPSQGKSAMMLNMASHIGLTEGVPCGIISIESSGQEIIERIFCEAGNIPSDMIATGFWGPSQMHDLGEMAMKIKGKPFFIYDRPNIKIDQIKSVARIMKNVFGARIIFVDYLQLIRNQNARLSKTDVVMESSQALKELAREINLPIVCLAQLGRDADERKPTMGDFQWSSQAEQDGDFCGLIWHELVDENTKSWLLVVKNRDGKRVAIPMDFDGAYYRFKEVDNG